MSKRTIATATPQPAGRAALAPPRHYDEAFQRHAVELWQRGDKPGTQIARELGIRYDRLKAWKRCYHGSQLPVRTELAAENRALKAELTRVREQRDILKKTLGILSEPPRSATSASKP
jgi:transposase-like protein